MASEETLYTDEQAVALTGESTSILRGLQTKGIVSAELIPVGHGTRNRRWKASELAVVVALHAYRECAGLSHLDATERLLHLSSSIREMFSVEQCTFIVDDGTTVALSPTPDIGQSLFIRVVNLDIVFHDFRKRLDEPVKSKTIVDSIDLLQGADQIAQFLYGDAKQRRKIYHLAETTAFPVFRLGGIVCARKSTLLKWIEEQERGEK